MTPSPMETVHVQRLMNHILEDIARSMENLNDPVAEALAWQSQVTRILESTRGRKGYPHITNIRTDEVIGFKVTDVKNRCIVRFYNDQGTEISKQVLRGRRKAKRVGRDQMHSLIVSYDAMPDRPVEMIQFTVNIERPPLEYGLCPTKL